MRAALDLFNQAGWTLQGQKLVNEKTGEAMTVEFLLDDPNFERVALPYKQIWKSLALPSPSARWIQANTRTASSISNMTSSPKSGRRAYRPEMSSANTGGRRRPTERGSQNTAGIKNPVIDEIIEQIIFAMTREDQIAATRALDRVLLWNYYVVSQFYRPDIWLPHWDRFGHPEKNPDYDIGFPTLWWWDEEKAKKVAKG